MLVEMKSIKKFYFVNAIEMHKQHPYSFSIPTSQDIAHLKIGDFVKICNDSERFWVIIQSIDIKTGQMTGMIDNDLIGNPGYDYGDVILFHRKNIYDLHFRID